jgi:hypothetical protein
VETLTDAPGESFSVQLEAWLSDERPKTIGALTGVINEKSFAVVLLLLAFPAALPLPTGGVTHVLELIALLVAGQMIIGRTDLWLPTRVMRHELGATATGKAIPAMVRRVRWFERFARPRLAHLLDTRVAVSVLGVIDLVLILGALLAPPFTGLDTLPALGVVIVSLGIVFDDALIVAAGCLIGALGVGLEIALGSTVWSLL